jgi:hypothetical protein
MELLLHRIAGDPSAPNTAHSTCEAIRVRQRRAVLADLIPNLKKRQNMNKVHASKHKGTSAVQAECEAEILHRARITASLREQRLKRDAEIAAAGPPATPPKPARKRKVA